MPTHTCVITQRDGSREEIRSKPGRSGAGKAGSGGSESSAGCCAGCTVVRAGELDQRGTSWEGTSKARQIILRAAAAASGWEVGGCYGIRKKGATKKSSATSTKTTVRKGAAAKRSMTAARRGRRLRTKAAGKKVTAATSIGNANVETASDAVTSPQARSSDANAVTSAA